MAAPNFVLRYEHDVEIDPPARKHGVSDEDIRFAYEHYLYVASLDSEDTLVRVLYLGPDRAGNLLELVAMELDEGGDLVIHAMKMSSRYRELLP